MVIWYILLSFGKFFPFWYAVPKISGNPVTHSAPKTILRSVSNSELADWMEPTLRDSDLQISGAKLQRQR
jgi:hypothetical protein